MDTMATYNYCTPSINHNHEGKNMEKVKEKEKEKDLRESPAGNSQLSLFAKCPRKWYYKYILGYKSKEKVSALSLGSAIHEAQEVFYLTGSEQKALQRGAELLTTAEYDKTSDEMLRMTSSITSWVQTYGREDLQNMTVLGVEKEFPLTLLNGYVMTIRVDSLMMDENGIFIRDTKTTKGPVSTTIRNYMHSPQPVCYVAAIQQSDIPQKDQLQGWRTDAIHSRVSKSGPRAECLRSDLVMPTEEKILDTIIYYTDLTDRIAYAIMQYEKGVDPRVCFPANCVNCLDFNRMCPHSSHCSKIPQYIPDNFELDTWLKDRTVLKTFDKIKGD